MKQIAFLGCSLFVMADVGLASAKISTEQATLTCDGHVFVLQTRWQQTSSGHIGWLAQALQVNKVPVQIGVSHLLVLQGRQTMPEAITGWQCIAGKSQYFVVLSYSCAADDGTGCDGHREWLKLLSAEGRSLDADMKREDPRQDALFDHLGIGRQLDSGVQMRSVIDSH